MAGGRAVVGKSPLIDRSPLSGALFEFAVSATQRVLLQLFDYSLNINFQNGFGAPLERTRVIWATRAVIWATSSDEARKSD